MIDGYYNTLEVCQRLKISRKTVPRVAAAGGVRVRKLPGLAVYYLAEDIERIATESIGVAGQLADKSKDSRGRRGKPESASQPA